jgi:hypothetical protein
MGQDSQNLQRSSREAWGSRAEDLLHYRDLLEMDDEAPAPRPLFEVNPPASFTQKAFELIKSLLQSLRGCERSKLLEADWASRCKEDSEDLRS